MKKYILAIWLAFGTLLLQAQTCPATLTIDIAAGQSSRLNAKNPVNFQTLFRIIGLPNNFSLNNVYWYIGLSPDNLPVQILGNAATAYEFGIRGYSEWGRVYVRAAYRCPSNNRFIQSNAFPLEVLDCNIYFFGNQATNPVRFRPNQANPYFDRTKPTVLYVHGWNKGSVAGHKREALLDNTNQYMIKAWRDSGYNVGIFYWNQYSDEDDVSEAEAKIYGDGQAKKWKREGALLPGEASDLSFGAPPLSIKEQFLDAYYPLKLATLQGGSELRVAGHSLGAQLSVFALDKATPASYNPDRIAMLDPFWNLNRQAGLKDALVNLGTKGIPIEWYTTSCVQSLASALNNLNPFSRNKKWHQSAFNPISAIMQINAYKEMVGNTAYVSINPKYASISPFDPVGNLTNEHNAAVWWYFTSIQASGVPVATFARYNDIMNDEFDEFDDSGKMPLVFTNSDGPSAASCRAEIAQLRGDRYIQIKGTGTLPATDDIYLAEDILEESKKSTPVPLPFNKRKVTEASSSNNASVIIRSDPDLMTTQLLPLAGEVRLNQPGREPGSPVSYRAIINCGSNIPQAVSWHLGRAWRGTLDRQKTFYTSQASCGQKVKPEDYKCTGFDRGHIVPSGDRNGNAGELADTYFMHNMTPMNPQQNQYKAWYQLEQFLAQNMVGKGGFNGKNFELFIVAGTYDDGATGGTNKSGAEARNIGSSTSIVVPGFLWKVALVHVPGQPFDLDNCAMIGFSVANRHDASGDWKTEIVPVDEIENMTGYDFFDKLPDEIEDVLEAIPFDIKRYLEINGDVEPGSDEEKSACESLTLTQGFNAQAGARFRGYIDPSQCNAAKTRKKPEARPEIINTNFRVMPNPASTRATVSYTDNQLKVPAKALLHLVDINGRVLINQPVVVQVGANFYPIDMSRMSAGIYIVRLQTDKGKIWTSKLVKQ